MFFLFLYFLYFLLFCLLLLGSIDFWESPQYFFELHVLPMSSHASFHKHATSIHNHTTRTTTSPNLLLASKLFNSSILLFKELSCDAFLKSWVQTSFEEKNVVNDQASCLLNCKKTILDRRTDKGMILLSIIAVFDVKQLLNNTTFWSSLAFLLLIIIIAGL